jgi:hypothetical protein
VFLLLFHGVPTVEISQELADAKFSQNYWWELLKKSKNEPQIQILSPSYNFPDEKPNCPHLEKKNIILNVLNAAWMRIVLLKKII